LLHFQLRCLKEKGWKKLNTTKGKPMKAKVITSLIAILALAPHHADSAISITIASPNTSSGLIYQSDGTTINTVGFARVGKVTGTIDFSKSAVNWANYQYWNNIFADVNGVLGKGSTPSSWNFNSSGALSGSSTGIISSAFTNGTLLYLWAFNYGSVTQGSYGAGSAFPIFTEADFTNNRVTQWALLQADEWTAPADNLSKSVVINQITPSDIRLIIAGTDLGNSVAMVPEPSAGALLMIGAAGLVALRRLRKV
jgi:hypothetical protein